MVATPCIRYMWVLNEVFIVLLMLNVFLLCFSICISFPRGIFDVFPRLLRKCGMLYVSESGWKMTAALRNMHNILGWSYSVALKSEH